MGKVLPRATGLAEVLWSGPTVTDAEGAYGASWIGWMCLIAVGVWGAQVGSGVPVDLEVRPGLQGDSR